MVERLFELLSAWDVRGGGGSGGGAVCVLVKGAGTKAFCAGGDVKHLVQAGHPPSSLRFFRYVQACAWYMHACAWYMHACAVPLVIWGTAPGFRP